MSLFYIYNISTFLNLSVIHVLDKLRIIKNMINLDSLYRSCSLCPRNCKADRTAGKTGYCRCGSTPRVNLTMIHRGEEPVIAGEGGAGAVFFEGCSLHCVFCQNSVISQKPTLSGKEYSAEDLADEYLRLQSVGADVIDLVTFMHFAPTVADSIEIAKSKGLTIPVAANISGFDTVDTLKLFDGLVDIYMPDFKFCSAKLADTAAKAPDYFDICCKAIAEMYRQVGRAELSESGRLTKGIVIRHLMLPGQLIDSKKIINYLTSEYGNNVYISLMNQYTPMPQIMNDRFPDFLRRRVSESAYSSLINLLIDKNQVNAFTQEEDSSGTIMIPKFTP